MARSLIVLLVGVAALLQVGCQSIGSTMLTRDESNQIWTRKPNLKGVPITLKVPTHVKLHVFERHYLERVNLAGVQRTRRLRLPFVVRDFAQEFIYTEKIFTVDFKRPAAGTYNLRLDLTDDQYIQKLQHDITDKTIEQVGAQLKALSPQDGFLPKLASGTGQSVDDRLQEIQSLVAVGVFSIDDPDFEEQVAVFINHHLNQANDAWVVPPSVRSLNRAAMKDSAQQLDLRPGGMDPHGLRFVPPPESAIREVVPRPAPGDSSRRVIPGNLPVPAPRYP